MERGARGDDHHIANHEITLCVFKEGNIAQAKMFQEKGLEVGKSDGLDWLQWYLPIKSKLDPANMGYQAVTQQMFKLQTETTTGKTVRIEGFKTLGSNVGGAPTRFTGRVGCDKFGDLPAAGKFLFAKGELTTCHITYSTTGDRHRCYRNGKENCVLTNSHPATDECRKPRRAGKFRGGKSGPARAQEKKENAGATHNNAPIEAEAGKYMLVAPPPWPPVPPHSGANGKRLRTDATGAVARH